VPSCKPITCGPGKLETCPPSMSGDFGEGIPSWASTAEMLCPSRPGLSSFSLLSPMVVGRQKQKAPASDLSLFFWRARHVPLTPY